MTTLLLVKYQKSLVFADVTHHSCIYLENAIRPHGGGPLNRRMTSFACGYFSAQKMSHLGDLVFTVKKSTFSQGPRFDCWWFLWRSSWSHSCHLHLWCLGLGNFVALLVLGTRGNSILFEKYWGFLQFLTKKHETDLG